MPGASVPLAFATGSNEGTSHIRKKRGQPQPGDGMASA